MPPVRLRIVTFVQGDNLTALISPRLASETDRAALGRIAGKPRLAGPEVRSRLAGERSDCLHRTKRHQLGGGLVFRPPTTHFADCCSGCSMIKLDDVSKHYHLHKSDKIVLNNVNFELHHGDSIGICGANGAGKSTLLRLLAGVEHPTTGTIERTMTTSWPLGYASCFQGSLTGADNARFISRIYNRPEKELLAFVDDFAQLGSYLYQPVNTYSAGMQARLAFGVSLAIEFECYIIDEVTGAGDERFRARSEEALMARRETASLVMTSHDTTTLRAYTKRGAVLYGGTLVLYETIDEACEVHHRLQLREL